MQHSVLAVIGADRVGLVDEVSEFVLARGGSIEDSRMVNLRGQFAIIMLVAGTGEALDRLDADLEALRSGSDVHAQLTPAATERTTRPASSTRSRMRSAASR